MKNTMKIAAAAFLAVGAFVSSNAFAQGNTSTGNVGVYSRIITPIHVYAGEEMNLGAWYGSTAGDITITPSATVGGAQSNGLVSSTGSLVQVNISGPNAGANNDQLDGDPVEEGTFSVAGEAGFVYNLAGATGTALGGGMTFTGFSVRPWSGAGAALPLASATLPAGPIGSTQTSSFNLGCTVHLDGTATPGYHNGSIAITATYN